MRLHYVLNHGGSPESKLADVEIHHEEGLLAGLKLVGCSVWKSKKGEPPTVLVPSRSYASAGGIRYYELLRPSEEGQPGEGNAIPEKASREALTKFKKMILEEYLRIESIPEMADPPAASNG